MTRTDRIRGFLEAAGWDKARSSALAGDASARRYSRLFCEAPQGTAILMDAPPDTGQDTRPFIRIAHHLSDLGFSAPAIFAADPDEGFLLLEDLGDDLFAQLMAREPDREPALYRAAVALLATLHKHPAPADLPSFTPGQFAAATDLVLSFYAAAASQPPQRDAYDRLRCLLRDAIADLPPTRPVLALRDFHAENLLWLPARSGVARVGLLDFQDGFAGHPTYDLVSLLEDARRDIAPELRHAMVDHYCQITGSDRDDVERACAVYGAQRNLRILGVFGRLAAHLGKSHYADFIPRVWRYLEADLAHPALAKLRAFVADTLPTPTDALLEAIKRPVPAPPPAMFFAAGFGTRMGALTRDRPKPLIEVAGKPLLNHALDLAAEARLPRRVVNSHYLGHQIADHLAIRPDIVISPETPEILDTGGGLKHALPLLGAETVFTMNTDAVWTGKNPFEQLRAHWDPVQMDALVLLVDPARARGHRGAGDFLCDATGRLTRGPGGIYSGAQILKTLDLAAISQHAFSLNLLWDRMIEAGRLFGIKHAGGWCDVGRPESIVLAEEMLGEAAFD